MKTTIASLLRHVFTALAGLGAFLATRGWIDATDVAAVNGAGVSLGAALVVILTAIIGRLALTWMGKILPGKGVGKNGSGSGGSLHAIGLLCMAVGFMGSLPACTTHKAPDGTTVTKPDPEGIALGMQLAEWAAYLAWDQEHADPHAHRVSQVPSAK